MEFLTTPDERFANLADYPFAPHYQAVGDGLQMHYVDEGPRDGEVVLCLHGEPSWSYLYRTMIPVYAAAGYRVIAPDLIGFGKSSKPTKTDDYTYQKHVDWTKALLHALDLNGINLFCQDWGGLIGLRIVGEEPERFARVVVGNSFLPTGEQGASKAFLQWQQFSQTVPVFPVGMVIQRGTVADLSPEVVAAYDAPFPDESYKAGARIFPALVPTSANDPETANNKKAWETLIQFDKPFLTLFSDSDPITKGAEQLLQKLIPGTIGQPHHIIETAGHFLQEEKGVEIADRMVAFMRMS